MACNWTLQHFQPFCSFQEWSSPDGQELGHQQERLMSRIVRQLAGKNDAEIHQLIACVDGLVSEYLQPKSSSSVEPRALLSDLTEEDIARILDDDDFFGECGALDEGDWDNLEKSYGCFVASYMRFLSSHDLNKKAHRSDVNWSEIFAILALNSLGEAIVDSEFEVDDDHEPPLFSGHAEYLRVMAESQALFEGLDLITISELLSENNKNLPAHIETVTKRQVSLQNQQNISVRYESLNRIKSDFIRYYYSKSQENLQSNRSELARSFYSDLSQDQQRELAPSLILKNAVRTLVAALREPEKYS